MAFRGEALRCQFAGDFILAKPEHDPFTIGSADDQNESQWRHPPRPGRRIHKAIDVIDALIAGDEM
jgi:hypothetical protein